VSVALDHARAYLSRGWRVIPVPFQSKKPTITGWPALRLDEGDLAQLFQRPAVEHRHTARRAIGRAD
jgi:hypothetical protein